MIRTDGWQKYNIWEHSQTVRELYARRCRMEAEEMTAHAQAVELLGSAIRAGETLLDAGCGSGYFYHALRTRAIPLEYFGVDASPSLIQIGREILPAYGLPAERLIECRLEDLDGEVDHAVCVNVLSNIDNYHRPLERLLRMARRTVILRESTHTAATYTYVRDEFLDEGVNLKVHVNTYNRTDFMAFIESYGYRVSYHEDRYTRGEPQLVIGYPHYWGFFRAERT